MCSGRNKALEGWYHDHARKLPWRDCSDPYQIWVSEIMLQQTQVKTVLPRYGHWFKIFPNLKALAAASLDEVLKAWEGLGYYRRARLLHAAAQQIVEQHNGIFPQAFDAILALPGIGRSTAGAIASICFGERTPVLDGNVKRVLQRWEADSGLSEKQMWQLAQQNINAAANAGDWNQAMMELGATLCTPRNPGCDSCPVSSTCASAFKVSESVATKQIKVRDVHWRVDLYTSEKGIWLTQRPATGIWAGLWTPPIIELEQAPESKPDHIHLLTHRRIHLYAEMSTKLSCGTGEWISDLSTLALPTGIHRLLEKKGFSA